MFQNCSRFSKKTLINLHFTLSSIPLFHFILCQIYDYTVFFRIPDQTPWRRRTWVNKKNDYCFELLFWYYYPIWRQTAKMYADTHVFKDNVFIHWKVILTEFTRYKKPFKRQATENKPNLRKYQWGLQKSLLFWKDRFKPCVLIKRFNSDFTLHALMILFIA